MTLTEIESFIEKITVNQPSYDSNTSSYVNELLDEAAITSEFDYIGYESDVKKLQVICKLIRLWSILSQKNLPTSSNEFVYVLTCLKLIHGGYALSKENVTKLNEIYQRHA
jgi:hypothetical protein